MYKMERSCLSFFYYYFFFLIQIHSCKAFNKNILLLFLISLCFYILLSLDIPLLLLWYLQALMPANNCHKEKKISWFWESALDSMSCFLGSFHEQIYFPFCLYGTRQSWSCLGLLASMALQTFISMTNRIPRENEDKMIVQEALIGVKEILLRSSHLSSILVPQFNIPNNNSQ